MGSTLFPRHVLIVVTNNVRQCCAPAPPLLDRKYYNLNSSPFLFTPDEQPSPPSDPKSGRKCSRFLSISDPAVLGKALDDYDISITSKSAQSLGQMHKIRGPQICRRVQATEKESSAEPIAPLPLLSGSVLPLRSITPNLHAETGSAVTSQRYDGFVHQG